MAEPGTAQARTVKLRAALQSLQELEQELRHDLKKAPVNHNNGQLRGSLWEIQRQLGQHHGYFSQSGQDAWIANSLFPGKRHGIFLEIGGYDGITGSNCVFFEKFRGWNGIIVEPVPDLVNQIRSIRDVPVVQAAVGAQAGNTELLAITAGYRQMSGMRHSYSESQLQRVRQNPDHREELLNVQQLTLTQLLQSYGLKTVDYCSIDAEGAELEILQGYDFDAAHIKVFSIENNTGEPNDKIMALMEKAGYSLRQIIGVDEIYVHSSFQVETG